ncbi:MAG: STAS domain-containing protein [Phycisphaera sp. RhM]|nr:STAS domain-containing protein [Phycisphaera sp. RhM]
MKRLAMAKYRHRTFEMFEFHDEAAAALAVKPREPVRPLGNLDGEPMESLNITVLGPILHVRFDPDVLDGEEESESQLRGDLTRLAKWLQNDSRVIVDFDGLSFFSAASIEALETFYQRLKAKGSRLVLCNLDADVKASFYPSRLPR